jgi:hypothetical protein
MSTLYIVHCVDTEGPLAEQPLGLDYEPPRSINENFGEGLVETIAAHRQRVLGRWEDIFQMLRHATSEEFRNRTRDSEDRGWIYNWFCMDHVGAMENPRQRAMGIHNIFDVYHRLVDQQKAGDAIHWHFHPTSTYHQAHRCATSYINSPELWEILCRRLIDRAYFPVANRAGFQDERPDSHWFLEQWIPFDFSNLAGGTIDIAANPDMVDGRFNDWRLAPADWSTYHPSHDSYQLPGSCRRKIARCLNVLSRFANINEEEMDKAFRRASGGRPTLVAFSSHDWRDLTSEVNYIRYLIARSSKKYAVGVKFCEAVEAFNAVHPEPVAGPLELDISFRRNAKGHPIRLDIGTVSGKIFGPQPFLAVQTRSRRYIHDNFNLGNEHGSFNYVFDEHSILPEDISSIGVAANDAAGRQFIYTTAVWAK